MKKFHIHLSMGHDTPLQFYGTYEAETKAEALDKAWADAQVAWGPENLERAYKRRGVQYLPYHFVEEDAYA